MSKKGADLKRKKLEKVRQKKRDVAKARATKAVPPKTGAEFMAACDDFGPANVARLGHLVSLQPWIGMCALPVNLVPYRGCSNMCSYCFVNQMARGNIGRKPGARSRKFYGSVGSLEPLEQFFQVSQGRRKLSELPEGRRLHGWFFQQRIPARLSALTDPFMQLEKTRGKSHEILRLCKSYQYPVIINTKGGDLFDDAFDFILSLPHKIVQVSLISVDDDLVREYEPSSAPPSQRLAAIKRLTDAGVYVSVRMTPLIPDERIIGEEHLAQYAEALAKAGVDFVEVMALRVHRGIQSETENEALAAILPKLDTELLHGNQYSIPLDVLKDIGHRIRGIFGNYGVQYSSGHCLGRFAPFGDDIDSACHCADLEAVGPPFDNYYRATFAQLGLEAKRLWEEHKIPILIQRSDLDRYPQPPDNYIFPARSQAARMSYHALLNEWWVGIGEWYWLQPYFFQLGYMEAGEPALDYDPGYGLITYFYDAHAPVCGDDEMLERRRKVYAERACMLLSGEKVPFPEDNPNHPFWQARRAAYARAKKEGLLHHA